MIALARQAVGAVVIVLVGWVVREFVLATPSKPLPACVCGCPAEAHEHYRRGVDCGACGPAVCAEYERPSVEHLRAVEYAESVHPFEDALDLDDLRCLVSSAARARRDAALGRPPLH